MASLFQTKTKKIMTEKGYRVLKVIRLSDNGFPDLLCMKQGKSIWIECKEKNDSLKPLQEARIDELNNLGFIAFCLQDQKGIIYPKNYSVDL
jgi:hypothetical protein